MCEDRKSRTARRQLARKRTHFHFLSFFGGALVMLIVGALVLLNGRGGDPVTTPLSAAPVTAEATVLSETPIPTASSEAEATPVPTDPPEAKATPAPTAEPEPVATTAADLDAAAASAFSQDGAGEAQPDSAEPTGTGPFAVSLNVKDKIVMNVGETGRIKAKLDPADPSASLVWKSSNEKVVRADEKGNVKAVGTGTAKVGLWINGGDDASAVVTIKVEEKSSGGVWIVKTGKKYHSSKDCSNMKSPIHVSLSEAKDRGYTACSKCY